MKKFSVLITVFTISISAIAQITNYDVAHFSLNEVDGTARFSGLAGAMGAMGGDASAIFYNPAGIGIYKSSEITLSGNIGWTNSSMAANDYIQDINVHLSNASYVGTWNFEREKGLLNFNFGVSYNRSKNFDRIFNYASNVNYSVTDMAAYFANGITNSNLLGDEAFENPQIGWLPKIAYDTYAIDTLSGKKDKYTSHFQKSGGNVERQVKQQEIGQSNEFAINFGGNISNILFWGMSFVCNDVNYTSYQSYYEKFANGNDIEIRNTTKQEGAGFTYKIGLIGAPTRWMRVGLSYHTPTLYRIRTTNFSQMYTFGMNEKKNNSDIETPRYDVRSYSTSPMKVVASLGFLLGKYGFIDIDYQWTDYNGMVLRDNYKNIDAVVDEYIKTNINDMHTIRVGIEGKPIEQLSLRLGATYSSSYDNQDNSRIYFSNDTRCDLQYYNDIQSYAITAGVGYRSGRHNIDLAYMWQVNQSSYYDYNNLATNTVIDPVFLRSVRNQMVLTYGIRF